MSDAVIIAAIGSISTLFGIVIVAWLNTKQNRKISKNVDDYHTEVNGKMEKLLDTTEKLGQATGKAEEKDDQEKKEQKNKPKK